MQQNTDFKTNDTLTLEARKKLSMTGVEAVDGFSAQTLKLTVNGVKVMIIGQDLKITAFNKATGSLTADGTFNEIKYNAQKKPLLKRVLK